MSKWCGIRGYSMRHALANYLAYKSPSTHLATLQLGHKNIRTT